ncbi:MAG: ABC transporter substrate-binding protein [Gammaproteobacteria bacterium]|nr:ABC transporter substrate-binding protein [Gammaproteobacteria bacterium]
MKKFFIALWLVWMTGFAGASAAVQPPQDLIKQAAERMLTKLKEERAVIRKDPGRVYELVSEIVLPHFDFERMSSWVLGKHWRTATPDQKKRFTEEFRNLLVRTYATSLTEYTDRKINYLPFRGDANATEVTVRTEVEQPGTAAIPIDYSLFLKNNEWLVYDVAIDNVSLVTNYRSTFANELRQNGLDKLISKLAESNRRSTATSASDK